MTEEATFSIGVIGGGQLAAMLADVCNDHGCPIFVLDPDPSCPAAIAGAECVPGDSNDLPALSKLAGQVDVITVEIENINIENLRQVQQASGRKFIPSVEVLARLVNKHEQKRNLQQAGIATCPFVAAPAGQAITDAPFGYPMVWKASRGGYDGRGVIILEDVPPEPFVPEVDGFIEAHVSNAHVSEAHVSDAHVSDARVSDARVSDARVSEARELAVMVAVSQAGELACWEPVEMVFTPSNMLDYLISPANVSETIRADALRLARDAILALSGDKKGGGAEAEPGIFGVEMFLVSSLDKKSLDKKGDGEGQLLVNEIAPRTHNSGHVTMDAAEVSQFEQQYCILSGQRLKSTCSRSSAAMFNLLGAAGYRGKTVQDVDMAPQVAEAGVHIYGKRECFPGRKMGHVTLTADSIDDALQDMARVRKQITIRGKDRIDG